MPPHARATNVGGIEKDWAKRGLPDDLEGKTVLDVGGWAGGWAKVASNHNAGRVLLIDSCRSPKIIKGVEFQQMDFMSDTAYQLPQFDVVLLFGILYHVHDPVGMLYRARRLCKHSLYLETACMTERSGEPKMETFDDNTNWFKPNVAMVKWMMRKTGFEPTFVRQTSSGTSQHKAKTKRCVLTGVPVEPKVMEPRGLGWMKF